jgi:hypothetical protein
MRRTAFVVMALLGVVGLGEAGDRKLPKAISLVQRQAEEVAPHASLRDEGMPKAMSLVQRQPEEVVPHASLRDEGMPEAMSLVQRQPEQQVHIIYWVVAAEE